MNRPLVLIVEDDQWLAEHYVRVLSEAGFGSCVAANALEAMDALDQALPDAILLDLLLPATNAFTLLHELRTHVDLAAIPVIICSNATEQVSLEALKPYGVKAILAKATMLPTDITAAVRRVIL